MQILGVDLDRTLIYSSRFLEMHPTKSEILSVEKTDTNESFISTKVIELINKAISAGVMIVPVTSRSILEYERINIPGVQFEYAITSAGGKILHNGEIDTEWEDHIDKYIDPDAMEYLMHSLNGMDGTTYKSKVIDGVYVFSKVNDIPKAKEELIRIRETHPKFSIQMDKHKIYATSTHITKGESLLWLKSKLGASEVYAFGDSMMDVAMLEIADKAFTPSHNTIDKELISKLGIEVVDGGTECISNVLRIMSQG